MISFKTNWNGPDLKILNIHVGYHLSNEIKLATLNPRTKFAKNRCCFEKLKMGTPYQFAWIDLITIQI